MRLSDVTMLRKVVVIVIILLLLISMLTAVGTVYCRYITVVSGESETNVKPKVKPYLWGGEEWISETLESGVAVRKTEFTVGNYSISTVDETSIETVEDRDISAVIRIFASGANIADKVYVRLTSEDSSFIAVPETVNINTSVGKKYGVGVIYRFFDTNGRELVWNLPGGVKAEYEMMVSVTGSKPPDENEDFSYSISVENILIK